MQVLIIDDSPDDALLLVLELKRAGYDVKFKHIATPREFQQALEDPPWDLILCDYSMPSWNARVALQLYIASGVDASFIVVSGVVGEYMAAQMIAAGADDYIAKGRLIELAPAVARALARRGARQSNGASPAVAPVSAEPSRSPSWSDISSVVSPAKTSGGRRTAVDGQPEVRQLT